MTILLACRFEDGAIITADSRATWVTGSGPTPQDSLQKILFLGDGQVFAFAGDVRLAAMTGRELVRNISANPRRAVFEKRVADIPRIARAFYKREASIRIVQPTVLMLSGTNRGGEVEVRWFESPDFEAARLSGRVAAFGSGRGIEAAIQEKIEQFEHLNNLKDRANQIWVSIESELEKLGIDTIGGLLQIAVVSPKRAMAMSHGSLTLNPDLPPQARELRIEKGKWVQRGGAASLEQVPIIDPVSLLQDGPREVRVHEYLLDPPEQRKPTWHLTYLFTCFRAKKTPGDLEFHGVWAEIGAVKYPAVIKTLVAFGAWGSIGEFEAEVYICDDNGSELAHRESVSFYYLPEERDFRFQVSLRRTYPGPAIVEVRVGGEVLGRRSVYFGHVEPLPHGATDAEREKHARGVEETLISAHGDCTDRLIDDGAGAALGYFSICGGCESRGVFLRFEAQMMAVFARSFPARWRLFIAAACRMSKGSHEVRVEFVNAGSGKRVELSDATVESKSSCKLVAIHGETVVELPEPGWYYVNLLVDGERIGTEIIAAETENPRFSYQLPAEDAARVASGETLALVRRSQKAEERE